MCISNYTNCIRHWCKLLRMPNNRYHRIFNACIIDDIGRDCWATKIKNMFTYGFGYAWINQEIDDNILFIFKQCIIDSHTQNWHGTIQISSRGYHYKYFITHLETERYLFFPEYPNKI